MHWLDDKRRFEAIFVEARNCVATDSGRLPTALQKITFDDAEIRTKKFAELLQKLMAWSADDKCLYLILDPDPVYYFHRLFGKYPIIEIHRGLDSSQYLSILNEGPPESPADSLAINWSECVIVPPSGRWFMHAMRSALNDGGHLWVPSEWVSRVIETYPYARKTGNTRGGETGDGKL